MISMLKILGLFFVLLVGMGGTAYLLLNRHGDQPMPQPTAPAVSSKYVVKPTPLSIESLKVTLPYGWVSQPIATQGLEKIATFTPKNTPTNNMFPRILIRSKPYSIQAMTTAKKQLTDFGFVARGAVPFASKTAEEYTTELKGAEFETGNPLHKDVSQAIYIFVDNKTLYQIDLAYFTEKKKCAAN